MPWSPADLVTVGFFAKRPGARPTWLDAPQVDLVCSVCDCDCATQSPANWVDQWVQNELWLFDSLALVDQVVPTSDTSEFLRYGLRTLPVVFDSHGEAPLDLTGVTPQAIPKSFVRLGYDLCSRTAGTTLECSPLSCNDMAAECQANRWCLIDAFDDALRTAKRFATRQQVEPGPYLLLEVWANMPPDLPQDPTSRDHRNRES